MELVANKDDPEFREYLVEWSIEVSADSPEAAAKIAWAMIRGRHSTANVFDVIEADGSGEAVRVDLQELLEESEVPACTIDGCTNTDVESTYCGSYCHEHLSQHVEECEVCARDFA